MQLVAQALQLTRQIDPRTPMVVSFDQPWGEYLAMQQQDLAPFHFADALVRAVVEYHDVVETPWFTDVTESLGATNVSWK